MTALYRLLGLNNNLGQVFYMIQDLNSTVPMQVISEEDTRLLTIFTTGVVDANNNPVQINRDGQLICSVPIIDCNQFNNHNEEGSYEFDDEEDYDEDIQEYDVSDDEFVDDIEDDYADVDYSNNQESDYSVDSDEDDDDISYEEADYTDYGEDYDDEDDYFDYETEEETAVTKLYALLNEEQIKVLKQYYLWYSQRVFENKTFDPTLGIKNQARLQKKLNDLNIIRNTGGLWHYAGFIDVGRKGADYCTLGHPLRYVHLAWDVTASSIETAFFGDDYNKDIEDALNSNNCVKFGVKCISDFFEANQDCMHALLAAQRQTLQDMQILYDYYKDEKHKPGVIDTTEFDELEKLINTVLVKEVKLSIMYAGKKAEYDKQTVIPAVLCTSLQKFKKVGLIPPKSMVQLIRDYILGWNTHKFITTVTGALSPYPFNSDKIWRSTTALFGSDITSYLQTIPDPNKIEFSYISYRDNKIHNGISAWLRTYLCYEICGFYKYTASQGAKDEGGASKKAKELLNTLYNRVKYCKLHTSFDKYNYQNIKGVLELLARHHKLTTVDNILKVTLYYVNMEELDASSHYYKLAERVIDFDSSDSWYSKVSNSLSDKNGYSSYSNFNTFSWLTESTLEAMQDKFNSYEDAIKSYRDTIKTKSEEMAKAKMVELNKELDEEIARKAKEAEEKAKKEVEEAEEAKRKAEEEAKKAEEISKISDENEKIYQYLINYSDKVTDFIKKNSKFNFAGKVFATISKSGKKPSEKQMVYLRDLYNAITGESLQGVVPQKVDLSSRKDLEEAIDYCLSQGSATGFEDRTLSILSSIKRFGKISEKQMKYAEQALEHFNKTKGV